MKFRTADFQYNFEELLSFFRHLAEIVQYTQVGLPVNREDDIIVPKCGFQKGGIAYGT